MEGIADDMARCQTVAHVFQRRAGGLVDADPAIIAAIVPARSVTATPSENPGREQDDADHSAGERFIVPCFRPGLAVSSRIESA